MKIVLALGFSLCCITLIHAQTIEKSNISNGGYAFFDGTRVFESTFGQAVVGMISNEDNIITQGFQQSYSFTTSIIDVPELKGEVKIYPNPARYSTTLEFNIESVFEGLYRLYDLTGREILKSKINTSFDHLYPMDLSHLKDGLYIIQIQNLDGKNLFSKTLIIQK